MDFQSGDPGTPRRESHEFGRSFGCRAPSHVLTHDPLPHIRVCTPIGSIIGRFLRRIAFVSSTPVNPLTVLGHAPPDSGYSVPRNCMLAIMSLDSLANGVIPVSNLLGIYKCRASQLHVSRELLRRLSSTYQAVVQNHFSPSYLFSHRKQKGPNKMEAPARRPYTWKTVLIIIAVSWGSAAYGYAGSIIATTLGQPSFIKYMGLDTAPNAAALIGTMNGLFYTGGFIGTAFIGRLSDRYGRKFSLILGTSIILVSNALLAGSVNVPMFIVFRFFQGLGYVFPSFPLLCNSKQKPSLLCVY